MEEPTVPHFFKEIKDRTKLQFVPFNDLYFVYLLVFVLLIGGIGIWISIYQEANNKVFNYDNVILNIGTYYLALITTSYIDITTNEKIQNKKSLVVYSLILLMLIGGIFSISLFVIPVISIILSILGVVISLFIWHLANCENEKFNDESYNQRIRKEARNTHGNSWNNRNIANNG